MKKEREFIERDAEMIDNNPLDGTSGSLTDVKPVLQKCVDGSAQSGKTQ